MGLEGMFIDDGAAGEAGHTAKQPNADACPEMDLKERAPQECSSRKVRESMHPSLLGALGDHSDLCPK